MSSSVIRRSVHGAAVGLAISLATPAALRAQSAENVAIVVNENSADSVRIAEHYARTRGLAPSNILRIRTATEETIDRDAYVRTIEQPLGLAITRGGIQDRLLYLVLTKGVPLRIAGTTGLDGTAASVDSELTMLYRRLVGEPVAATGILQAPPLTGSVANPYYLGDREVRTARPFSHREHDIYLVARIDAFTVEQALALIDRAQAPVREGAVVLDQRGTGGKGDEWMQRAADLLTDQGQGARVLLEKTAKGARGEQPVLGYYSWGASDPENRVRSVGMRFVPGSIAASLASFDARTFRQPPDTWRPVFSSDKSTWFQGSSDALIADLIHDGVTGVSGQVDEAYVAGAVRPEILFPAYVSGFNLVEAFYLAMPTLSWQAVVIGDPLCAPFSRTLLSRDQLEEPVDPATGYPGLFAKRRIAVVLAGYRDVPPAAAVGFVRAQSLLERGDRSGAKKTLEEVVAVAPQAVGPLAGLAQLEEDAGDYDAAIARYRRVLELQPKHLVALNNLAYSLAVRRNLAAEALPLAQQAALIAPGNPNIVDTLAWIQHLLGNNENAAKLYDAILRLAPAQAELRLHAAIVYAAISNFTRAGVELKEALRLDASLDARAETRQLRDRLTAEATNQR
jgi:uncharacterized protein (TIGR03790 family)